MQKILIFLFLIMAFTNVFSIWNDIPQNSTGELFEAETLDLNTTKLNFQLDGYEIETQLINGKNYQEISYWNEGEFVDVGKPNLPRFTRLVAIPAQGEVTFKITSQNDEVIQDITVYPRQNLSSDSKREDNSFVIDEEFYNDEVIFPGQIVEIASPAIMRDYRIVPVTINPFQYSPLENELSIFTNLEITIECNGLGGLNKKTKQNKRSKYFESMYRSTILNYNYDIRDNGEFQEPCYLFIYPDDANVESVLQILADWKHQKGFDVVMTNTSETGTTLAEIKSYIQDAYDTWENPPEFVCLVGDAGGNYSIPTGHLDGGMYNGEGDHVYTTLEGDDILADVFIGRLSFNSILELQTIVAKILNYEKEPYLTQTEWYDKTLLVGDPSDSGPSCIETKQNIKQIIELQRPDFSFQEVYDTSQGSWVYQIQNGINEGMSYFNYRGFANMSGWNNNSIDNLTNGNMMPVVVSLTCLTGDFEGTNDCISERFLKAGSPGNLKGAVAAISTATGNTHTCFNNCVDVGIFHGIFVDEIYHMGGALNRGKLNLYLNYPGNPANAVDQFSYWNNLMGDPGMEIWTGIPQGLVADYSDEVVLGTNFFVVNVEDLSNLPVENAWVTILKGDDEIFQTGLTNENGEVIFPLEISSTGEVTVTITKHDFIPHINSFNIVEDLSLINVDEYLVDDDNSGSSSGNGNGIMNPGENIELSVSLENFGISQVNSVSVDISSISEYITITDSHEDYGNIAPGTSVYSADDFDFSVHPDALDGTIIQLDLNITDNSGSQWTDYIYLLVEGANLIFVNCTILDNSNGIFDPGETAELQIMLENNGNVGLVDVSATISCENSWLNIDDPTGFFNQIQPGNQSSNTNDTFQISAGAMLFPGTQLIFDLHLYNTSGYNDTIQFVIDMGDVTINDPLGPDEYGYSCYDDGDLEYYKSPSYQWVEIDPVYGGGGTVIPLVDVGNMGDTDLINLPFNFKFYGVDYSNITVCSNGWIAPGECDLDTFMNWSIPSPSGPSPIIAPFWDDLIITDGNVCYYYNVDLHCFIIEWSRLLNEYNSDEETFELIIYDQAYYPTSTEDNEILFQYKVVNNSDQGSYGGGFVNHGQFATVGIEDQSGTIGLEYTYNNSYPTSAKLLQNEMAILFTLPPIQYDEPYLVITNNIVTDSNGNGQIDYGETIDLGLELTNLGINTAHNISAVLSSSDDFITLNSDFSEYNDIIGFDSGINLTDFEFDVAENCPDGHLASMQLTVTCNENSWELYFGLELNAPSITVQSIYMDDGNNHIFDPGEVADIIITFINNGGSEVLSLQTELISNDQYFTLNSSTYNLGDLQSGEDVQAVFSVSASANAPLQHEATFNWNIVSSSVNYSTNGEFSQFIAQIPVFFEEYFDYFPPLSWQMEGDGWLSNPANLAGGQPPEIAVVYTPPNFSEHKLISEPINTLGTMELELEFKHTILENIRSYIVGIETTDDGINWTTVWEESGNLQPTTENIIITGGEVGSANFQFAFVLRGTENMAIAWVFDDIILNSVDVEPHGFIVGDIVLNGGGGNVEDVIVSSGETTINPDINGHYCLPVPMGEYDITASLPGYISAVVENVTVGLWESVEIDLALDEISIADPPQNLSSSTYFNNVTLNWEIPGSQQIARENSLGRKNKIKNNSSSRDERSFIGYRVYRNDEMIDEVSGILNTTYDDFALPQAEYNYYVTAVYSDGESEPSNSELVNIVLAPPENLTYQVNGGNVVILEWDTPSGYETRNITGFRVYRDNEMIAEPVVGFFADLDVPAGLHYYYATTLYGDYESDSSNIIEVEITSAGNDLLPMETSLGVNFPNPFNPRTTINFQLSTESEIELSIFNIKGEKVKTLIDGKLSANFHSIEWNGTDEYGKSVSSGIYFYKMKTARFVSTKKMILMK